jgi:hypothetical protein
MGGKKELLCITNIVIGLRVFNKRSLQNNFEEGKIRAR